MSWAELQELLCLWIAVCNKPKVICVAWAHDGAKDVSGYLTFSPEMSGSGEVLIYSAGNAWLPLQTLSKLVFPQGSTEIAKELIFISNDYTERLGEKKGALNLETLVKCLKLEVMIWDLKA